MDRRGQFDSDSSVLVDHGSDASRGQRRFGFGRRRPSFDLPGREHGVQHRCFRDRGSSGPGRGTPAWHLDLVGARHQRSQAGADPRHQLGRRIAVEGHDASCGTGATSALIARNSHRCCDFCDFGAEEWPSLTPGGSNARFDPHVRTAQKAADADREQLGGIASP